MAAIHDLIAQIGEARLRERITAEWAKATRERKFGLVFEDHLPELLPLPKARPRKGDLVCQRGGSLKDLWRVQGFAGGRVQCRRPQPPAEGQPAEAGEFELADLMVVREFGEPIFPALVPVDAVANGGADAPWHTLIEADNYHALQLLEYLYAGQVDCIYIDPPYNTGARDWKYNNDYVDEKDDWRHSKWLAFISRRLMAAKALLRPQDSVLVVTIDEKEYLRLGLILEQLFPEATIQMVSSVINPKGSSRAGRFSRVDEYIFFCYFGIAEVLPSRSDMLRADDVGFRSVRWASLIRNGEGSRRTRIPSMFYPIYIDEVTGNYHSVGSPPPVETPPSDIPSPIGTIALWPIDGAGQELMWRLSPGTFANYLRIGHAKFGRRDALTGVRPPYYLQRGTRQKILSGEVSVVGKTDEGALDLAFSDTVGTRSPATVWNQVTHSASEYGAGVLKSVLPEARFPYPKSIYAVRDTLGFFLRNKQNGLVLDFFAGSGTSLHAVNLMNATSGGQRRCILVTNNEVSVNDVEALRERGLQPGDHEWEAQGICRSVTWPRSKFTILGRRDDGSLLPGDYLTGRTRQIDKPRRFTQIGFVEPAQLDTVAKRKQVVALIDGLPQTAVTEGTDFVVSEDHAASVLFNPAAAEAWLEALEGQDHIASFYIVTPVKKLYDQIKAAVSDLLGPLQASEDDTRPMRDGFPANLAYFKLDFLDPERVSLKRAFREVLPLLWLKAGAVGPRPVLPPGEPEPALFEPEGCQFVVLLQESRLTRLLSAVQHRTAPLSHVFIVTDSDESFKRMAAEVRAVAGANAAPLQVLQLYRDYLANFLINRQQEAGDAPQGAAP